MIKLLGVERIHETNISAKVNVQMRITIHAKEDSSSTQKTICIIGSVKVTTTSRLDELMGLISFSFTSSLIKERKLKRCLIRLAGRRLPFEHIFLQKARKK